VTNSTDGCLDCQEMQASCSEEGGSLLSDQEDQLLDTVGAVAVDHSGNIVAAVSSGGIVLKQPGRLGQAALYACGCWAENYPASQVAVGVSTSGCGEHLTKTLLARECAQCLKTDEDPTLSLNQVFQKQFLNSPFLRNVEPKLGGALAVRLEVGHSDGFEGEVLWAHTTDSMCLAFMSTEDTAPTALVSRLPDGIRSGKSCVVQSQCFTLPL
jgi:taspase (threonine aspartase 1)